MKKGKLAALAVALFLAVVLLSSSSQGVTRAGRTAAWIRAVVTSYFDSLGLQDLDMHINCFARRVNFYGQDVSRDQLRDMLSADFSDKSDVKIIDYRRISVSTRGALSCRQYWSYCGGATTSCGEALTRFGLTRERGQWKIRSVRNAKIYWSSSDPTTCRCETFLAGRRGN